MKDEHILRNYRQTGKDFITFPGLLDEAHRLGLMRLESTMIQVPNAENGDVAIFMARVETTGGMICTMYGDANPRNVGPGIGASFIRMAETRACARALRMVTNYGLTAVEELPDADSDPAEGQTHKYRAAPELDTLRAVDPSGSEAAHSLGLHPASGPARIIPPGHPLWAQWRVITEEARALGITVIPIRNDASREEIKQRGVKLREEITEFHQSGAGVLAAARSATT